MSLDTNIYTMVHAGGYVQVNKQQEKCENNVFIGDNCGTNFSKKANSNVCIGSNSGTGIGEGKYNVFIGANSGPTGGTIQQYSGNIERMGYIGSNSSNSKLNKLYCGCEITTTSDGRIKQNIENTEPNFGLEFIKRLRPINYIDKNVCDCPDEIKPEEYKDRIKTREKIDENGESILDKDGNIIMEEYLQKAEPRPPDNTNIKLGLIAQEVHQVINELGLNHDKLDALCDDPAHTGGIYTLGYTALIFPLIKSVQKLSQQVDEKDQKIATLEADMAAIKAHLQL